MKQICLSVYQFYQENQLQKEILSMEIRVNKAKEILKQQKVSDPDFEQFWKSRDFKTQGDLINKVCDWISLMPLHPWCGITHIPVSVLSQTCIEIKMNPYLILRPDLKTDDVSVISCDLSSYNIPKSEELVRALALLKRFIQYFVVNGLYMLHKSLKKISVQDMEVEKLKIYGNECFRKEMFKDALNYYGQALAVMKKENLEKYLIHANRALTFLKLKQFKEAVGEASIVLELYPQNLKCLYCKIVANLSLNNQKMALKDLEYALSIAPNEGTFLNLKDSIK